MIDDPLALERRAQLPDALRVLAEAYPRASWEGHANFGQMVQFWMQRHAMFRDLVRILRADAERFAQADVAFDTYAPRLSRYGSTLLNELHAHHQIEDQHYFPQLIKLDARLERGFDLLERDHEAIDPMLHGLAEAANAVLKGGAASAFVDRLDGFARMLERHLTDEEEVVVPVILDSGFKG